MNYPRFHADDKMVVVEEDIEMWEIGYEDLFTERDIEMDDTWFENSLSDDSDIEMQEIKHDNLNSQQLDIEMQDTAYDFLLKLWGWLNRTRV